MLLSFVRKCVYVHARTHVFNSVSTVWAAVAMVTHCVCDMWAWEVDLGNLGIAISWMEFMHMEREGERETKYTVQNSDFVKFITKGVCVCARVREAGRPSGVIDTLQCRCHLVGWLVLKAGWCPLWNYWLSKDWRPLRLLKTLKETKVMGAVKTWRS